MNKISVQCATHRIIWCLTVFILVCFLVFDTYSWGKYVLFIISSLIFVLSSVPNGGVVSIKTGSYQFFLGTFTLYVFASSLWAMNSTDSLVKAKTLFSILICFTLIYVHYAKLKSVDSILRAVMWSGYMVALYSISFYGLRNMMLTSQSASARLGNEYTNINSIGMTCAVACVIQFSELQYKNKGKWTAIFMLPAIVVIAATQSRKALVFLIGGIFTLLIIKNMDNRDFMKNLLKIVAAIVFAIALLFVLSQLDIFSGVAERMNSMLGVFTGEGKIDSSALKRNNMISLGIEWWKKNPLVGIGIGNPHIINAQYMHFDAYLHNNYVELLCGGGIVGLVLYYSMHIYIIANLFRYRRVDKHYFSICIVWVFLMLAMDYGMVSYYDKTMWFNLMIQFLNIQCMKRRCVGYTDIDETRLVECSINENRRILR